MKKILLSALLISIFASCKKLNDVLPAPDPKDNTENIKPTNPEDGKLLASIKITPVAINNVTQQPIKVSTDGKTLNLSITEQVQLLYNADRYVWYILFKEDFSGNHFNDFDFMATQDWGEKTYKWTTYNVDQMGGSKTDTLIAGVKVKNVKFKRIYRFYKEYSSNEEATAKANALVSKKEIIKFLTRYEPDADTTRYNVSTINAVYEK